MDRMKKGIGFLTGLIIILGILLLVWYFVVSYYFRSEYTLEKVLVEMPILTEADKVETYVRSFQNAVELSLMQGSYDASIQTIWPWGVNAEMQKTKEEFVNDISHEVSENLIEYLKAYREFAQQHAPEMELPEVTDLKVEKVEWDNETIEIIFEEINFSATTKNFHMERDFKPRSKVRSRIGVMWEFAEFIITNDTLGNMMNKDLGGYLLANLSRCKDEDVEEFMEDTLLPNMKGELNTLLDQHYPDFNIEVEELWLILASATNDTTNDNSLCEVEVRIGVKIKDKDNFFLVGPAVSKVNPELTFRIVREISLTGTLV